MQTSYHKRAVQFAWWKDRSYLLLSGVMFMSFLASGLTNPLFSLRAQGLGATLVQIGLIGTATAIAGTAVQYLWGRQSDRLLRRRPLLLIGMLSNALTTLAVGLIHTYEPLYWIKGLNGLAFAAYSVGSLAMIGDILEGWPNRGAAIGIHRGSGSLAFGLAALFGGHLADQYGLAMPFLLGGLFGFIAFLLACFIRETPVTPTAAPVARPLPMQPRFSWAKVQLVIPFLLMVFLWSFSMGSAFAFWPVYMVEQGFAKTVVTQLWGIAALGETLAMILAGHFSDRFGSRRVVAGGLAGMGLIFMAYTFWPRMPWLIPIQLVRSLAFSCYSAAVMIYSTEMGLRQQRGRMAGLQTTFSSLGSISGSAAGGAIAQGLGLGLMIRATGALMALGGLFLGWKMAEPEQLLAAQAPIAAPAAEAAGAEPSA